LTRIASLGEETGREGKTRKRGSKKHKKKWGRIISWPVEKGPRRSHGNGNKKEKLGKNHKKQRRQKRKQILKKKRNVTKAMRTVAVPLCQKVTKKNYSGKINT